MLQNYFTIALRFMIRQKGFSVINISGLTLGIASSLLILLYVNDELSFDSFHESPERIHRVIESGRMQGKELRSAYTGYPMAYTLLKECPSVEATVRLANWPTFPVRYKDRANTEPNLLLADSNFFRFFNFRLLEGNVDEVLSGQRKLVITESAAKRYFDYKGPGDKTPLGKEMVLAQGYTANVSGIAADPPLQSHFHFSVLLSMDSWLEAKAGGWVTSGVITYLKLKENAEIGAVENALQQFTIKYVYPELKNLRSQNIGQFSDEGNRVSYHLQPMLDIHLNSNLFDEIEQNNDISYIYIFISIAVFITILACINFMNLSTARSASRAKEVGVRKSVGAPNSRIVAQFLLESYFYILVAVVIAMFIIMVVIGPFNVLADKELNTESFFTPVFLTGIVAFTLVVGLLAGSYPAFYLSYFSPIEVLKGRVRNRLRSYGIRNVLVVFQFFISVGLIIATLTVYEQLRYTQQLELGFDKSNVVNLIHTANLGSNGAAFKKELLQQPEILSASYSNRLPPNINWQYVFRPLRTQKDYIINVYEVDYDHLKTMRFSMVKGRFFSRDFPGDSLAVILNETAAKYMKMENIHNERIFTEFGDPKGTTRDVIGIIHDFNFQSLRDSIQPIALVLGAEPNWEMAIRIKKGDETKALEKIHTLWLKHAPDAPYEYTFLDKNFEAKLGTEKKIGLLFLLFTVLAIFIACLGLFGLATFTAELRTKEIGIRKVMGASVQNIVVMLNKDFLKLVLIANLLAWPVTGWLMHHWLERFAYHTSLPWWSFIVSGVGTIIIAFFSVSSRAIRAAQGDPVNSLRDE
jgi:putative ABC transport system permease protein